MINSTSTNKMHVGFTLIELLVVISIIGLLASVTLASLTEMRLSAQYAKARIEIKMLANLADFARGTTGETLLNITSNFCTECQCRISGGLPTTVSIHNLPPTHTCVTSYYNTIKLLNTKTDNLYKVERPPLDPWGAPYLINENEGEGGNCAYDNISSAGPNGLFYDTDDVVYNLPPKKCNNPITHHPTTNWN